MDIRREELTKLRSYTEEIDKDLTMILQSLQWDRKHILEHPVMVSCKYDSNHKIFPDNAQEHERGCLLQQNGYLRDDQYLPDALSDTANTLIKLSKEDIAYIIDNAAKSDPTFKKGVGSGDLEPQTFGRLQCTYSADERRVIHAAVVSAAPSCHDLTDLALPSVGENEQAQKTKTRTEILAELRDMRRRRTKYRVAAKSRNYSDVLRDVIKTQMELYNDVIGEVDTKPDIIELNASINKETHQDRNDSKSYDRHEDRECRKRQRDGDNEKFTREKSKDDGQIRRHESRDIHNDKRHNRDYRSRDINERITNREKPRERQTNRSRDKDDKEIQKDRQRDRSKEREYRKRGRDYERFREDKQGERSREQERSKGRYNVDQRDSDAERARNLLNGIKRELDDVEGQEDAVSANQYDRNASVIIKQEKRSTENASKDKRYHRHESNGHSYLDKDYSYDRSRGEISRERNGGHRSYKERRESDTKDYRHRHDRHKESHRDKSYDMESKRARVEEKHKTYYEIYAELDSLRSKRSE